MTITEGNVRRRSIRPTGTVFERPGTHVEAFEAFQLDTDLYLLELAEMMRTIRPNWDEVNAAAERRVRVPQTRVDNNQTRIMPLSPITHNHHGLLGEVHLQHVLQRATDQGILLPRSWTKKWDGQTVPARYAFGEDGLGQLVVKKTTDTNHHSQLDALVVTPAGLPVVIESKLVASNDFGLEKIDGALSRKRLTQLFNPLAEVLGTRRFGYMLMTTTDTPLTAGEASSKAMVVRAPATLEEFKFNALRSKFNARRNR